MNDLDCLTLRMNSTQTAGMISAVFDIPDVGPQLVRRLVRTGEMEATRDGHGCLVITGQQFIDWIRQQKAQLRQLRTKGLAL